MASLCTIPGENLVVSTDIHGINYAPSPRHDRPLDAALVVEPRVHGQGDSDP